MSATAAAAETPLAYERRLRPRFAIVALLAGVLLLIVVVIQTAGPQAKVAERTLQLIVGARRGTQDIIGAVVTALDSLAIAGALYFLVSAARRRNPEMVTFIGPLTLVAGGLTAVATVIATIASVHAAHQFVKTPGETYMDAQALSGGGVLTVVQILGLLGAMLLSVSLILTSLQAMRVGLLPRFLGYVGMLAAVVIIIPTLIVVEMYWFVALALLLIGRWPSGNPPAWESGKAEPWPSAQAMREQRIRDAAARGDAPTPRGRRRAGRAPSAATGGEVATKAPMTPASTKPSPATAKRKRKRKR